MTKTGTKQAPQPAAKAAAAVKRAPALAPRTGAANSAFSTSTGTLCKLQPIPKEIMDGLDEDLRQPLQQVYSILCSARTELVKHYYELGCVLAPVFEKYKKGGVAAICQQLEKHDQHAAGADAIYHALRFAVNVPLREAQTIFSTKLPWGIVRRLATREDPAVRAELMARAINEKMTAETFGAILASEYKLETPETAIANQARTGRPRATPKSMQAGVAKLCETTQRSNEFMTEYTAALSVCMDELQTQPREEWAPELLPAAVKARQQLQEAQQIIAKQIAVLDRVITPPEAASNLPLASTRPRRTTQAGVSNG